MAQQLPLIGGKVVYSPTPDGQVLGVTVRDPSVPQVSVPFTITATYVPSNNDEPSPSTLTFAATVPDNYEGVEFLLPNGVIVTLNRGESEVTLRARDVLTGSPEFIYVRTRVIGGAVNAYREIDIRALYTQPSDPGPDSADLVVTGVPTLTFASTIQVGQTFTFNLPTYTGTNVIIVRRYVETDAAIPLNYNFPSDNLIFQALSGFRIRPVVVFRQVINGVNTDTTVVGAYTSTTVLPAQARILTSSDITVNTSSWVSEPDSFRASFTIASLSGDFEWTTSALSPPNENQWEPMLAMGSGVYQMRMRTSASNTLSPPPTGVDYSVFGTVASEDSRRTRIRFRWRPNALTTWSLASANFSAPRPAVTPSTGVDVEQWNWIALRTDAEIGEEHVTHESLCSLAVTGFDARLGGGGLQGGHCMYVGQDGDFLYLGDMNGFRRTRKNQFLWHYPEARNLWCVSGNGSGTDPDLPSRKFLYVSGAYYSNANYQGGIWITEDDCESFELLQETTAAHCDTRRATNLMAFYPVTPGTSGTALTRANARKWRCLQWSGEKTAGDCRFWVWTGAGTGLASRVMPSNIISNNKDNSPTFGFVRQDPGVQGKVYLVFTGGIYRISNIDTWVANGDTTGNSWAKIAGTAIANSIADLWIDPTNNNIALVSRSAATGSGGGLYYSSNFQATTPTWTKVLEMAELSAIGVGPIYNDDWRDIIMGADRSTGRRVPIRQEWRFRTAAGVRQAPGDTITTGAWDTNVWKNCSYDTEGYSDPDNVHVREMMGALQGAYYLPDPTNRLVWQGSGYMCPGKSTDGGKTWTRNDLGFCGINPTGQIIFGKPTELGTNPTYRCDVAITDQFATVTTNRWQTRSIILPNSFDVGVVKNATIRIGGTTSNPINLDGVGAGGSVGARAVVRIPNVSGVHTSARNRVLYSVGKSDNQCLAYKDTADADMKLMWYTGTGADRQRRSASTGGGKHNIVMANNHLTDPNIAYIGPYVYNINASGVGTFSYVHRNDVNTTDADLMNFIDRSEQDANRLYAMRGANLGSVLWYTTTGHAGTWSAWYAPGTTISLWGYKGAYVCPHNDQVVMFATGGSSVELRDTVTVVKGDPGSQVVNSLAVPDVTTLRQTSIRGMVWCGKYPQRAYLTLVNPGGPRIYRLNFNSAYTSWTYQDITYNAPLFGNIWSNPNTGEVWTATQGQGLWVLPAPEGTDNDARYWLAANRPTPRD